MTWTTQSEWDNSHLTCTRSSQPNTSMNRGGVHEGASLFKDLFWQLVAGGEESQFSLGIQAVRN